MNPTHLVIYVFVAVVGTIMTFAWCASFWRAVGVHRIRGTGPR